MELLLLIPYALVYFAGYYGGHVVNLAARRVLVRNLRIAGLALLFVVTAAVIYLMEVNAPPHATAFAKSYVQGRFATGPALIVAFFVGLRMFLERRKARKSANEP